MKFGEPRLLWLLCVVPALMLAMILAERLRQKRWARASDDRMLPMHQREVSRPKRILRSVLWITGVALCVLALARPQYGASTVKQSRRGLDLVIAIDTSKSMLAKDLQPDRLTRSKLELSSLLDQLRGDRVAFVAFAGQAFIQCPLTSDYSAAKVFLRALDTKTIPRGGTAIAEALKAADALLDEARTRGGSKSQVVVVITDGEDHEGAAIEQAKALHDKGVAVFTIGVGSTAGEPLPIYNDRGDFVGYMKDAQGQTVLSRLNENILKDIAQAGGGRYVASSGGSTGVEQLVGDLAGFEREEKESKFKVVYADRFQWVLVPGALFLLVASLLSSKRRQAAVMLVILGFAQEAAAFPWPSLQNTDVKEGNAYLQDNKPDEALSAYERAKDSLGQTRSELWLNQGLAHLKKGSPKDAEPLLERALLAEDKGIRARAHYLLGNAAFDAKDYARAIQSYKKSLKEVPGVRDVQYNLELAQRLLKKQEDEKKKQDQQNKDQNKDQQDQKDQQKDQKDQKDQKQEQKDQKQDQKQNEQKDQQQQQQPSQGEKNDKEKSRMQLLEALQAEEKPMRFDLFKAQQQKRKERKVEKDW
jgi:Ca-activated chloride channel family protein